SPGGRRRGCSRVHGRRRRDDRRSRGAAGWTGGTAGSWFSWGAGTERKAARAGTGRRGAALRRQPVGRHPWTPSMTEITLECRAPTRTRCAGPARGGHRPGRGPAKGRAMSDGGRHHGPAGTRAGRRHGGEGRRALAPFAGAALALALLAGCGDGGQEAPEQEPPAETTAQDETDGTASEEETDSGE